MLFILLALAMTAALAAPSLAAFSFSFPVGTITAGPGVAAAGPTSFDTYYSTSGQASVGGYADYGVGGLPLMGVPFYGPGSDCFGPCGIPPLPFGMGGCGMGYGAQAAGQTTFATSFDTAGAGLGICGGSFAGQFPLFTLNLY